MSQEKQELKVEHTMHPQDAAETLRRDTERLARIHGSGRILALLHAGADTKSS